MFGSTAPTNGLVIGSDSRATKPDVRFPDQVSEGAMKTKSYSSIRVIYLFTSLRSACKVLYVSKTSQGKVAYHSESQSARSR